jgi:hypothetical protein
VRATTKLAICFLVAAAAGYGAQSLADGVGSHPPASSAVGASLPTGAVASLGVAGPLAVSPDGRLYVVDTQSDRILVRLPDGNFRVVAGDGTAGFSGDGGPAVDAELTKVTDIAFAPSGSLFIADGARVRVVAPNGIISTVAGDGQPATWSETVASGTPALSSALPAVNGLSIALSTSGVLYISTGNQILYLDGGRLDAVQDRITSGFFAGKQLNGFGQVAVDSHGDIDISGFNGWAIWQIAPDGVATWATNLLMARRSGGNTSVLERAPDGSVYGEDGSTLLLVKKSAVVPLLTLNKVDGQWFFLTYFAFAPNGTIYADEIPGGGGFEWHQQLASESDGHVSLLWQEDNPVSR